ncbi:MAG TPA: DedA family protein [Candidatus Bathyarchaeia archaeon]|nr:DedA family protein [Candidatus Bathyarchaeia archaeon]
MLNFILQPLAQLVINIVDSLGLAGVFLGMMLQSACIPLPSEIILPFAGFLVSQGIFDFWPTILMALLGGFVGSSIAFSLGYFKGETFIRQLIKKYGKYILVFEYELNDAQKWFRQYGQMITFISRILPVVRTFIALPAGMSGMSFIKFIVFVLAGDFLWSLLLVYFGLVLGNNWVDLKVYFEKFDLLLLFFGVAAVVWYINHKLKKNHRHLDQ